jgi:hypothetical protein
MLIGAGRYPQFQGKLVQLKILKNTKNIEEYEKY